MSFDLVQMELFSPVNNLEQKMFNQTFKKGQQGFARNIKKTFRKFYCFFLDKIEYFGKLELFISLPRKGALYFYIFFSSNFCDFFYFLTLCLCIQLLFMLYKLLSCFSPCIHYYFKCTQVLTALFPPQNELEFDTHSLGKQTNESFDKKQLN